MNEYEPALPFDDPRHFAAHHFLVEEAAVLDAGDWARWLGLLTADVRYVMPVRVTTVVDAGYDARADMAHFDEDRYAIEKRVQRLLTDHAWTEDPPSRARRFVSNVRVAPIDGTDDVEARSYVLLYRSRGDVRPADLVSAGRTDVLRRVEGGWILARRDIVIDEAVLRTQNLALFL